MRGGIASLAPGASRECWWSARRRRYNALLIAAGIIGFIGYVVAVQLFVEPGPEVEVTLFTTAFQGVGYLVYMAVANVCYLAGPAVERAVPARWRGPYRRAAFAAGCSLSVAVPLSVPAMVWWSSTVS